MSRAIRALVDGVPATAIDVADRGFQYGHGMFETCRIVDGRVPLWAYHRARLLDTAIRLGIVLDVAKLELELTDLIADHRAAVLKVLITAGNGGRGYRYANGAAVRIVSLFPLTPVPMDRSQGVRVRVCRTRLAIQPALAGLKHLNRLEQVLARAEWSDPDIAEGLMCDTAGRLVEGTSTNVFLVSGDRIATASLERCGVAGVMRRLLIDERPGIGGVIDVRDIAVAELAHADEIFLTNAVSGVWPVRHVCGIGDIGVRPGRIAADIRAALEARFGFGDSQ
jgi:4-amino-4-deoxychorismate lyase